MDLLVQVKKDYQVGAGSNPAVAVAVVGNNGHLIHTMGGVQIDGACISLLYRGQIQYVIVTLRLYSKI